MWPSTVRYVCISMVEKQGPWEASSSSSSVGIPIIFHYRVATSPRLVLILSHAIPIHAFAIDFFQIDLNITLPSTFRSFKLPFPTAFPSETLYAPLRATCPAHVLDLITQIIIGEECRSWSSSICSFLQSPHTTSLLDPNIYLSLCPPSVWEMKFHSHVK